MLKTYLMTPGDERDSGIVGLLEQRNARTRVITNTFGRSFTHPEFDDIRSHEIVIVIVADAGSNNASREDRKFPSKYLRVCKDIDHAKNCGFEVSQSLIDFLDSSVSKARVIVISRHALGMAARLPKVYDAFMHAHYTDSDDIWRGPKTKRPSRLEKHRQHREERLHDRLYA